MTSAQYPRTMTAEEQTNIGNFEFLAEEILVGHEVIARDKKISSDIAEQKSVEEAMALAFEIVAKDKTIRNKVYVWKQRFREGKLSRELMKEILAMAGFECVVEEKWKLKSSSDPEEIQETQNNE